MMSVTIPATSQYVNDPDINITTTTNSRRASGGEIDFRTTKRRKIEVSPKENDILFYGNAKRTCGHPGNVAFVDTVKKCLKTYQAYNGDIQIAKYVVEGLTSQLPPVRFLHQNATTREWSTLSSLEAIVVTNHALMTTSKRQIEVELQQSGAIPVIPKSRLEKVPSSSETMAPAEKVESTSRWPLETTSLRELMWGGFSPLHMYPSKCSSTYQKGPRYLNSPRTVVPAPNPLTDNCDEDISIPDSSAWHEDDDDLIWSPIDLENVFADVFDGEDDNDFDLFDLM